MVASILSIPFTDTDTEIESKANRSIANIFAESGESGFRVLESEHLQQLHQLSTPHVIALGGGAILSLPNRECIRKLGLTVWLQAEPETIFGRIAGDETTRLRRPKLSQLGDLEEIRAKLVERWDRYNEVAGLTISTEGASMRRIAEKIAAWYALNSK
jgi:shikimate kinase